jgi:hypothetical protein
LLYNKPVPRADGKATMKLRWMLLYLKYRRYLIPAAVVLVLLIGAYFLWPR